MPSALARVNPKVRDQTIRAVTAGVAGPALIWAGVKYPGTFRAKAFLVSVGAAIIYVNYSLMKDALEQPHGSETEEGPEETGLTAPSTALAL